MHTVLPLHATYRSIILNAVQILVCCADEDKNSKKTDPSVHPKPFTTTTTTKHINREENGDNFEADKQQSCLSKHTHKKKNKKKLRAHNQNIHLPSSRDSKRWVFKLTQNKTEINRIILNIVYRKTVKRLCIESLVQLNKTQIQMHTHKSTIICTACKHQWYPKLVREKRHYFKWLRNSTIKWQQKLVILLWVWLTKRDEWRRKNCSIWNWKRKTLSNIYTV